MHDQHQQQAPVTRVVLAEDGVLLREGLAGLLQRFGFHVAAAQHEPDLVITDIRMPPSFTDEGLRAAVDLRRTQPGLPVVVLSQYVQHAYAAELLKLQPPRPWPLKARPRVPIDRTPVMNSARSWANATDQPASSSLSTTPATQVCTDHASG